MRSAIPSFFALLVSILLLGGFTVEDSLTELTAKFNSFNEAFPQNKLVVSFHQPAYAPGDTAFFRATLLHEDLLPVKGRQIGYLVLLDADGNEIIRDSFVIKDGIAGNQTIIPSSLAGGIYQLVAYTDWMKNFSSKMYFTSLLHISGDNYFEVTTDAPVQIELFPEGGNLITGLTTQVVAKATRDGMPVMAQGRIIDSEGNEVIRFNCGTTGLAKFELTPENALAYTLETLPGGTKSAIEVQDEGINIQVSKSEGLMKATLHRKSKTVRSEGIYVVLTSQGKIRYASTINIKGEEPSTVLIPLKNIPVGIAQLFLFDNKFNELASRLSYIEHEGKQIDIQLKDKNVATRSEVTFEISIKDDFGSVNPSNIFVNGYVADLFREANDVDFTEQILVASDLPDSYSFLEKVDIKTEEGQLALDEYLMTKKWERFDWDEILSNKRKPPEYKAKDILTYDGVATFSETGKPVPDSTLVIFFLQQKIFGYEVYTTDKGKFNWPVFFDFYGNENVMHSLEFRGKTLFNTSVELMRDSLGGFRAPTVRPSPIKDPYYSFSTLAKVSNTSYTYSWEKVKNDIINTNPNAAIEDELNGADFKVTVEDYVVFPTIEDLMREIVRFVQNKKVAGKPTLRVLSSDSNRPITGDPLYVVDGIATKNTDFILKMNPGDIAVIKVVNNINKLRNLGSISKNGVIFFQTKVSNMGALIPTDDILHLRGLNKPIAYNAGTKNQPLRTPLLKSSLYWNFQPALNERGIIGDKFYTPDNTGTIKLRVHGITTDGIPFEKTEDINVSFIKASN
ncbi:MAG TPA: hypothetical protein DIS90_12100 [Cytophagales bacterium]|nr:hypothetical protein [Cytophagales bacterium]